MKLWAISDLHLANRSNREALAELPSFKDDGLILGGDVGESENHLRFALDILMPRFRTVFWVPGNHDLWTTAHDQPPRRGDAKYRRLVEICRSYGVHTPEDPFVHWPANDEVFVVALLFTLYDYTFHPPGIDNPVAWAADSGVICNDEVVLHPDPYESREEWCRARLAYSMARLREASQSGHRLVLVNHWPFREDLFKLKRIPRFSIWCGSRTTENWHTRFKTAVAVYGHVHIKGTHFRDNVRFEEVSLGYPRDWQREIGVASYLRQILPLPPSHYVA